MWIAGRIISSGTADYNSTNHFIQHYPCKWGWSNTNTSVQNNNLHNSDLRLGVRESELIFHKMTCCIRLQASEIETQPHFAYIKSPCAHFPNTCLSTSNNKGRADLTVCSPSPFYYRLYDNDENTRIQVLPCKYISYLVASFWTNSTFPKLRDFTPANWLFASPTTTITISSKFKSLAMTSFAWSKVIAFSVCTRCIW